MRAAIPPGKMPGSTASRHARRYGAERWWCRAPVSPRAIPCANLRKMPNCVPWALPRMAFHNPAQSRSAGVQGRRLHPGATRPNLLQSGCITNSARTHPSEAAGLNGCGCCGLAPSAMRTTTMLAVWAIIAPGTACWRQLWYASAAFDVGASRSGQLRFRLCQMGVANPRVRPYSCGGNDSTVPTF